MPDKEWIANYDNKIGVPDILECGFIFPEKVTILAPGPNGISHWNEIDGYVIGVSRAIQTGIPLSAWLVSDWWAVKTDWFNPCDEAYNGVRIFSDGVLVMRSSEMPKPDYRFALVRVRDDKEFRIGDLYNGPINGKIRPDGTVSASAVELAARLGAREIALCGVDMHGDKYFDGKIAKSVTCSHEGAWSFCVLFNSLIKWVKSQGINIYSLSETALEL
jgi:hypothetical protein